LRWALIGVGALVLAGVAAGVVYLTTRESDPGGATIVVVKPGGGAVQDAHLTLEGVLRLTNDGGLATYTGLRPGPHDLVVSMPGFGRVKRTILIESGEQRQISIALRDAEISGRLTEVAAAPAPPTGTQIVIRPNVGDPVKVNVHRGGSFHLEHAPVGAAEMEVVARVQSNVKGHFDRYDTSPVSVSLKPGENTTEIKARISAVETMVRWLSLLEDGRRVNALRAGRLYHHSDAKKYGCPPAEYASDVVTAASQGVLDTDFDVLRSTTLRHWKFTEGGKTFRYRNAAEMAVRFKYAFTSSTSTVHAVREGKLWKTFPICSAE
jgi:hypothetical protein